MAGSWRVLDLGSPLDAHLPHLLISTAFEADAYAIHLTDLTHIWVESLDHAAILERAEEESTSIDPTDPSQLQILLSKLGLALSSGPKTTLSLHIDGPLPGRVRPAITLNLTIELPGGLAPLKWPVYLATAPQSVLTKQLMVPLLQAQDARIRERESLMEVAKEKDNVIQKLMDKFEAQGMDFGQVFPQATAKGGRKVDRARAEEKVRGLRPFDLEAWKETTQSVQPTFLDGAGLDLGVEGNIGEGNWWEKIKSSTVGIYKNRAGDTNTPPKPTLKHNESTQDNDAFQIQSTPPRASKAARAAVTPQSRALDDSTDDEDLDTTSQHSRVPDSFPISQALESRLNPGNRLGRIGGNNETPKKPSPDDSTDDERPSVVKPKKHLGKIGRKKEIPPSSTEEDTTDEEKPLPKPTKGGKKDLNAMKVASPPSEEGIHDEDSSPPQTTTNKPRIGKLGRIGGKKKSPPLSSSSPSLSSSPPVEASTPKKSKLGRVGGKKKKDATPTPPPSQQEVPASQTPAQRKLGAIGGRNKIVEEENDIVEAEEDEIRGRSVKVVKKKTPPRETSEERAEKKRRELKRELEAKAKAPIKKKRKF